MWSIDFWISSISDRPASIAICLILLIKLKLSYLHILAEFSQMKIRHWSWKYDILTVYSQLTYQILAYI